LNSEFAVELCFIHEINQGESSLDALSQYSTLYKQFEASWKLRLFQSIHICQGEWVSQLHCKFWLPLGSHTQRASQACQQANHGKRLKLGGVYWHQHHIEPKLEQ